MQCSAVWCRAYLAQVSLSGALLLSYFLLDLSNVPCLHLCFSCLRLYYCFLLRNDLEGGKRKREEERKLGENTEESKLKILLIKCF